MSKSVQTIIDKGEEVAAKVTLTDDPKLFEQLVRPTVSDLVDTVYDYLADPEKIEIEMLQAQIAPFGAILEQMPLAQASKPSPLASMPKQRQGAMIEFIRKISTLGSQVQTTRTKEAIETVFGVSASEVLATNMARVEYAFNSDTIGEYTALTKSASAKSNAKTITGMFNFATSENVIPFMQSLTKNIDREDMKEFLSLTILSGLAVVEQAENGLEGLMEKIEASENAMENGGLGNALATKMSMEMEVASDILDGVNKHFNPSAEGIALTKKIAQGVEDSLIDSGFISEADFRQALETRLGHQQRAFKGYDAMNGFDASKVTKGRPNLKFS